MELLNKTIFFIKSHEKLKSFLIGVIMSIYFLIILISSVFIFPGIYLWWFLPPIFSFISIFCIWFYYIKIKKDSIYLLFGYLLITLPTVCLYLTYLWAWTRW